MQFYQLGGELLGDLLFFLATNQQDQVIEACTSGQRLCLSMLLQCICICVHVCLCWFYPENEVSLHVKAKVTMMATSVCLPCSLWSAHTENIASLAHTNRTEIWRQAQGPNTNIQMLWILKCIKRKDILWNIFEYLYSSKPRHKCFDSLLDFQRKHKNQGKLSLEVKNWLKNNICIITSWILDLNI